MHIHITNNKYAYEYDKSIFEIDNGINVWLIKSTELK